MPVASHLIRAIEIFCSYAHKDESLRDELEAHLSSLQREGKIKSWHDRMIKAGEDWKGKIDEHLETAHIILLLISADFIKSDYCHDIEMQRAMQRHRAGEARVIPIILRPCDWETSQFSKIQALPKNALPVVEWPTHDAALTNVAKGIRAVVAELLGTPHATSTPPIDQPKIPPHPFIPRPPVFGFVARRDESGRNIVERLKEELAPKKNQLVTLSGPGGVGKTTLAAATARALKEPFGGRIVWSSAEGRADFTLSTLLDDIATQLGRADLRTLAPDAKEAQVYALVADPPAFVVLDNYETIAPDAQKRIEQWFAHAQCSALFTSRQRIGATLPIPIAAMSPKEAEDFLKRLIAQTQDMQIFSGEIRQRIYETAEANPFVMQWVVGQIDAAQEPQTVLEELAHGEGDAAERVFDRSFNLPQLGDDGRAALLALSLFAPSATRPALAEVAGFGDDLKRVNEAVKNLRALWLLKAIDENRRFTIEGLTRNLAKVVLSKDARAEYFHRRFVAYFLRYTKAHAQPLPEDFNELEREKDNLLAAMDIAYLMKDWGKVMDIAKPTASDFFSLRGYWDEAIKRNEQARDAAQMMNDEINVAVFSHRAGIIRQNRGEYDAARVATEEALVTYKKLKHEVNVAAALHQLATINQLQGELSEAQKLYNESLEIKKRLSNQSGIAITLHNLAIVARAQGEVEEARRLYNESLEIKKRLGDQSGIAITLHQLGKLAGEEGNKAQAVRLIREALGIFEKLKSPYAKIARGNLERLERESS